MTDTTALTASMQFWQDIADTTPDGERIRLCLQCGACSGVCPFGYVMEYPPHGMIAMVRAELLDDLLSTDAGWMCVSCYACTQVCPQKIPVTAGLTTQVKEEMLLAGNVPVELQDALEKTQRYFNPLGESPRKRAAWAEDFEPEVPIMAKVKRPVDVLWYVGDYPSYHPRIISATRAIARILKLLDVDFGILGPEEVSDGDSLRLAGETGLFEMLAEKNDQVLQKYEFNEILTTDPHAYNAFKNEYPQMEINYPVRHYTQFLADHLDQLQELMKQPVEALVTFHDPCYLGRVNGIFEQPRQVLGPIPGVELVEMSHNHETSLCCGGGGGGMWLDGFQWEKAHVRLSEWRVQEAVRATGELDPSSLNEAELSKLTGEGNGSEAPRAHILAVACPYEAPRFEDATKTVPGAGGLLVRDVAELLAQAIGIEG